MAKDQNSTNTTATAPSIARITRNKCLEINRSNHFYGSFAEIGAGQEVARHFFQAGLASQTVAKSMSAYDKSFSDSIYGKGSRFVSQERLEKMLSHEYQLLEERLPEKKSTTCFFSFANTVATTSHEEVPSCHGWMGIRFQRTPGGPANEIVIHIRMMDRLRLQQQEALGLLGVNLVYAAFKYVNFSGQELIASLLDNLSKDRLEINYIRFSGPDLKHFDNRILSLELVKQDISRAVLFSPDGTTQSAADVLYKKSVLVQRGTFRPVTNTNLKLMENGIAQLKTETGVDATHIIPMVEITMSNLKATGEVDHKDFLERIDTLVATGQYVMISNFPLFAQLKSELRRYTDSFIGIVVGAGTLNGLFDETYYTKFHGGIMAAFGVLMDEKTRIYVYPFKSKDSCLTASTFHVKGTLDHLYKYLTSTKRIVDLQNCDDVDTTILSDDIRRMLAEGDPKWESYIPAKVRDLIKERKLFGYGQVRTQS